MWNLKLCLFTILFIFVIFFISTINSSPVVVYHSSGKQPIKSQAIIVSNGNDNFKGDKTLKDNEVGYFTKSNEGGDDGYERFESFHDKDADSYGYEKHEAYGKSANGENQNGKTDGKTGHSYQVIEHQDEPVGLAGNKYKNDDGALSKGYSFSINSHYDDDSNGNDYGGGGGGDHYNSKYSKTDGNDDGEYYENDDDDDEDDDDDDSDDNGAGGHNAADIVGHAIEMLHSIADEKVIAAGKTGGSYKKLDDYKDYDYQVEVKHVDPVIEAKQQRIENYQQKKDYSNESIKSDDNNSDDNKLVDDGGAGGDGGDGGGGGVGAHNNIGYNSYETYIVHPEISKESGAEESSKSYEKYQIEIKDNIKPTIIATKEIIHENVKSTKKPFVKKNNNNNNYNNNNKKNSNPNLHTKIIENYDDVEDIDTGNYNNNKNNNNNNNSNLNNNNHYDDADDDDDDDNDERHSNYEYDNDYHHEQPKSIGGGGGGSSAHYRDDNKDDYGYGNHYVYASEADTDAILK